MIHINLSWGRNLRNRGFIYRWKIMVEVSKERYGVLREHS